METGSTRKLCVVCGADCAGCPRIRDPKGRYYHKECYERARERAASRAGGADDTPAPEAFDPFADLGPEPASPPAEATPCPACGQPLAAGSLVCVACGYSQEAGRQLETAVPGPAAAASVPGPGCPLCGRTKKMHKAKRLYGVPICRKCYYAFANRRQLAYVVDALLWWPASFVLGLLLGMVLFAMKLDQETMDVVITVCAWLVFPLVFFLKDGFGGYSPGKAICRVQVVDRDTLRPTGAAASFKRNLVLIIPLMPLVIAWWLQRGYRLGDGWAGTKVVWKKHAAHPLFTGRLACDRCQYDLTRTTTGRCPECGATMPGA